MSDVSIIGGGLAGCEAALVLASRGWRVRLFEMRPGKMTPAHETGELGELVCSNSLRSDRPVIAAGLLKEELRKLKSPLMQTADKTRVPAGGALAVDRAVFAATLTRLVDEHANIKAVREEVTELPVQQPTILAPGPLASDALMACVEKVVGKQRLFFFDAIAPILDAATLNMEQLFYGSRNSPVGENDYLNSPMNQEQYMAFVEALLSAEKFVPHGFETDDKLPLFDGCQPAEAIAATGPLSLAFGPMRPAGFENVYQGPRPFAVLQLRAENLQRTAYNLVGFQTRLKQSEQKRVFRMVPGLENATFLRFGSLHRNSYLDGPRLLDTDLSLKDASNVMVSGQFAGAEGYIESIALGHLTALSMADRLADNPFVPPPEETALGSLHYHVTASLVQPLQPSNIHWGLFPAIKARGKRARREAMVARARQAMDGWLSA
jgi:methylenetetrahydrofolate--tRNA-(uracil-5-)-methyltransferase